MYNKGIIGSNTGDALMKIMVGFIKGGSLVKPEKQLNTNLMGLSKIVRATIKTTIFVQPFFIRVLF